MIASVRGRVAAVTLTSVVVDVSGIGVELHCAPATLAGLRVGETASVPCSLVVREDSLTLFGFADDDERGVFELLQTASGVGPRLAQAMLAVHRPDALRRAVATEDLAALTAVPGIGRKGAQRIVLELKDRLGAPDTGATARTDSAAAGASWREQVRQALVGLGWSAREAEGAVDAVAPLAPDDGVDVAVLLRAALRTLSKA
jgi:Holliday junction DNA helicase RuvA